MEEKTRRQLWYFHFQHNFLSFFLFRRRKSFSHFVSFLRRFFVLDCVWCECGKSIITACASFAFPVHIHAEEPSAEKWEEGCAIWALNNVQCTHISYSLRCRAAARAKEISFPSEIYNIVITQFSSHIFFPLFPPLCLRQNLDWVPGSEKDLYLVFFFYVSARLLWWKREKKRRKNLCVRLAWWYWYSYPSEMMCYANMFI